jgi:hypothetical protein
MRRKIEANARGFTVELAFANVDCCRGCRPSRPRDLSPTHFFFLNVCPVQLSAKLLETSRTLCRPPDINLRVCVISYISQIIGESSTLQKAVPRQHLKCFDIWQFQKKYLKPLALSRSRPSLSADGEFSISLHARIFHPCERSGISPPRTLWLFDHEESNKTFVTFSSNRMNHSHIDALIGSDGGSF